MNPTEFDFLSGFVRDEAAIVLEKGKEYLVESRLTPILRDAGLSSFPELIELIKKVGEVDLRRKVVEALTTNETSFFRDIEPFEIMKTKLIPDLIERRKQSKKIVIWSAASSTGQEAYTLAMLIRENFPQLSGWEIKIFGTDISSEVVEKARTAIYTQFEVNRGLPVNFLIKYFEKDNNDWRLKPVIRDMVTFEILNLVRDWRNVPQVDVAFLRNVLIYFDVPTKQAIFSKLRKVLRPDGYMFLGAAETTMNVDDNFIRHALPRGSYYTLKGT